MTSPADPANESTGPGPRDAQDVAGQLLGGFFGDDGQFISLVTEPLDGFNDIYFDGDIVVERD